MDGTLLHKSIGIIGGGITGLIVGIFLAKEGHRVSIYEKNALLSETSSKTTKLLHGGLRYLESFHFNEVKNGLNDRSWWLRNFPKHTTKLQISIPFKSFFSLTLLKSFVGIKLYEILAGSKNLGTNSLYTLTKDEESTLKNEYKIFLSFFDGSMDDVSLGSELIQSARDLNIDLFQNREVTNFDIHGMIDGCRFDKTILAVGPWSKILLEQNNIESERDIDFIKGSHLIVDRETDAGLMFSSICKSRYIFALPYMGRTLLGTTEEKVKHPDLTEISKNEINYLIDSYNQILKKPITISEIISSYSGVLSLIHI